LCERQFSTPDAANGKINERIATSHTEKKPSPSIPLRNPGRFSSILRSHWRSVYTSEHASTAIIRASNFPQLVPSKPDSTRTASKPGAIELDNVLVTKASIPGRCVCNNPTPKTQFCLTS